MNKHQEFMELCKPLIDWLNRNYDPHASILITPEYCKVVRDEMGGPVMTDMGALE